MYITETARNICLIVLLSANTELLAQNGSMRGFADIHNHQFANLAFGGEFVNGNAYGAIDQVLGGDGKHSYRHLTDVMAGWVDGYPGPINYGNDGFPTFTGWPAFFEVSHQHVYQDWLLHAVEGGLRLMVMMAVDSPPLCSSGIPTDGRNCADEMNTINLQIAEAKKMQGAIDQQSGGTGLGWYRIVTTPAEARQVIQQGKLAVVLGVETAHLFNCKSEPCNWSGPLTDLWNLGVRHFFPIHQDDNAFGGPSYFEPHIQVQQNWVGDWFNPEHWFSPYKLYTHPCIQYDIGRCDDHGLTTTGNAFIQGLMDLGALIDVDHMSDRSFADTLDLAEKYRYPVVASHSSFNEIKNGIQDHEGQLTPAEFQRIRGLGGMLGLISSLLSNDGDWTQVDTYQRPGKNTIQHVCGRSSETFAQGYYYAIDHAPEMSFAIGTDFNGGLKETGPRFGNRKCDGGTDNSKPQLNNRLAYPFFARGSQTYRPNLKSGNRSFDFNVDGLANVGLLPDMFADLEVLGMTPQELEPLFNSAEGYVEMWEKSEEVNARHPSGYVFDAQSTQHVDYWGADKHIHELFWGDQIWHDSDLSLVTGAPNPGGHPSGYVFGAENTQHVDYRGIDGHIHEMFWSNQTWHDSDLSLITGAPNAAGDPSGYVFVSENTQHVDYRGIDGHIHEMFWSNQTWHDSDLSLITGAPNAAGDPSGYVFVSENTQHVDYRGIDGHIHEMFWSNQTWHDSDLSLVTGAPNAAGDPSGYVFVSENTQHVDYRGIDGHIHEMFWSNQNWHDSDLSLVTGAPNAAGNPSGYVFVSENTQHVDYRGGDGHIHEMFWSNQNWHDSDLSIVTGAPIAAGDPCGYVFISENTQHIDYKGIDGHIHELFWSNEVWHHSDLSPQ